MLAGDIMNESGISKRLIKFSNMVVGRFRGGLAQVNVLASIIFAGITGVALGDIAALGSVFIPSMVKEGYDKKFATAAQSPALIPLVEYLAKWNKGWQYFLKEPVTAENGFIELDRRPGLGLVIDDAKVENEVRLKY
ncbi:MAG: TRAP transporter large permease subunit [Firmicutes bacterium]|nr:TRAP transporter large permease subunit [Bacillota bacterium]